MVPGLDLDSSQDTAETLTFYLQGGEVGGNECVIIRIIVFL